MKSAPTVHTVLTALKKLLLNPTIPLLKWGISRYQPSLKANANVSSSEMHFCERWLCQSIMSSRSLLHLNCALIRKCREVTADQFRETNLSCSVDVLIVTLRYGSAICVLNWVTCIDALM